MLKMGAAPHRTQKLAAAVFSAPHVEQVLT